MDESVDRQLARNLRVAVEVIHRLNAVEEHRIYYCPACQTDGRVLKDRRLSRLLK